MPLSLPARASADPVKDGMMSFVVWSLRQRRLYAKGDRPPALQRIDQA
jgi:hypothetical protein